MVTRRLYMRKYHIPFDLISADGQNDLHEKINQDIKFSEYLQDFARLLLSYFENISTYNNTVNIFSSFR